MARKRRIEFPGAFYHVFVRGNNKQRIFNDEHDYLAYLDRIERYHKRYDFVLYVYVLMPNHVHFLLETWQVPLSKIMQGLQQSYTMYFHKKHKTVGHLFQGRYNAILIQKEAYLFELLRYIHLNPVRKKIVKYPEDYPWNSHRNYIGLANQHFVNKEFILKMFSENDAAAVKLYSQFMQEDFGEGHQDKYYQVIDQRILGDREFVEEIKKITEEKGEDKKIKDREFKKFPLTKTISLPEILNVVSEITSISSISITGCSRDRYVAYGRALFVFAAARYAGVKHNVIAEFLNKDASSITCMIRKIEGIMESDPVVSDHLDKIIQVFKV